MTSRLFHAVMVIFVLVLMTTPAPCQSVEQLDALAARLDALAEEMQLIEELNALQLTPEQLGALQAEVGAMTEAAAPIVATRIGVLQQLEPLLQQKRQALIADQRPGKDLLDRIAALEKQLGDLDERMNQTITSFAPRLREILTAPQVSIVSGEEDARRQVVTLLEAIRDMSAERFNREAPGYARELEQLDRGLTAQKIMNLFTTARNLEPRQYQQQQPEIVQGLLPIYAPTTEIANAMLAQFFAQPAMPGLLEDKVRALTNNP
ncbi:MAG: hypothetical protein J7M38_10530 [Armatimonadetes bacterium]|nr:hypothetical protein [Armatimonadota bacterium]